MTQIEPQLIVEREKLTFAATIRSANSLAMIIEPGIFIPHTLTGAMPGKKIKITLELIDDK